jgi:farnesyl-diphosphate farnesyltransferase
MLGTRITAEKPCLPPYPENLGPELRTLLRNVSRSFYLTLRVLPSQIRSQIGLAYLLARAADTIADTKLLPREERLEALLAFRRQLNLASSPGEIDRNLLPHQNIPAEKQLLEKLPACFALLASMPSDDQGLIADVVQTLTRGMEFDLTRFPGDSAEHLAALDSDEELDEYVYFVAGCVGPFWTKMCMGHLPQTASWNQEEMCALGIRFGKGLQLCNVLRDLPKDLRNGRCYLPSTSLETVGLRPLDLLDASAYARLQPVYQRYLDLALSHLDAAWNYTLRVPASIPRLRLACAWPVLIGLKTLAKLRNNADVLRADRAIKITRREVYEIMVWTYLDKGSDARLNRRYQQFVKQAGG